jgi:hypothetical protein
MLGVLCLAGLTLLARARPMDLLPGVTALLIGAGGLLRMLVQWHARVEQQRREQMSALAQLRRRSARREREAAEHIDRRRRAATDAAAREHARQTGDARRMAELEHTADAEARRLGREAAILAEADRLLALDRDALRKAAAAAFHSRGFLVSIPEHEAGCDLLLQAASGGAIGVARIVPPGRRAELADVRALDAWRRDEASELGFLLALAGFSTASVTVASALPLTLVDAHLLAQWLHGEDAVCGRSGQGESG